MNCPSCDHLNPEDATFCRHCKHPLQAEPAVRNQANSLTRLASRVFVGRKREMEELCTGLADMLAGRGHLVLLAGEPGIGKTRLAEEFAGVARQRGTQVLWGRCWEGEGAPAFWPWVQVVRAYVQHCDADTLAADLGDGAAHIAQVVPIVRERLPALPVPPEIEPTQARFRLFDSFTTFLQNASHRHPLVLIVDDLQWADKPSLLLLHFLARAISATRLLVIGTYRDIEVGRAHPLAEVLGGLARESQRLVLQGLAEGEVAHFIENTTGTKPEARLVTTVYTKTEGNPFFMSEIVHLLAAEGRLQSLQGATVESITIPEGVRETIRRRLERLSAGCNRLFATAAVIGREFGLDLLAQAGQECTEADRGRLLTLLEEALAAHLVGAVPGSVDRYRFAHALIRETLYEDLSLIDRTGLHRQVGEALEALYAGYLPPYFAELADHFWKAASGGAPEKAVHYAIQAGERATALLAYEEAVEHYEHALQALALKVFSEAQRCELLLALGGAQAKAGETRKARDTFQHAAEVARRLKAAEQVARAALGFAGQGDVATRFDPALVSLLDEALVALPEADSPLRVRVLGRLAMALYFSPFAERRILLSRQAVEMARRLGDMTAVAHALSARHMALLGPDTVSERLALATELLQLAEQVGRKEIAIGGHLWRLMDVLELGDITAADVEIRAYTRLAEELRQPFYRWQATVLRAMQALLAGRFEEGERLAQEGLTLGQQAQSPNAFLLFAVQLFGLRREQGRFQELEEAFKSVADRYPAIPSLQPALAFLYSELGREAEARSEFERLAANDFVDFLRDQGWFSGMAHLSQVASFLRDVHRSALLYEHVLPYAEHNIVVGSATDCYGSIAHYLGLLATTMSRWNDAERHFADAIAMNERLRAKPFVARSQYEYARMLVARCRPGDREHAQELLEQALHTAQELGMKKLEEKIQGLRASTPPPTPDTPPPTPNLFRQEGDYWLLAYEDTTIRLKDTKGLHYIAPLLQEPGREFHVMDLLTTTDKPPAAAASATYRGPSQEQLAEQLLHVAGPAMDRAVPDAQARSAYRRRLEDLQAEMEEAERFNDPARATKVQAEVDLITGELAAAYGVRGHARSAQDAAEKARKAVTNRIRAALAQIQKRHPALWRHLFTAIKTGTFCAYRPEHQTLWEL